MTDQTTVTPEGERVDALARALTEAAPLRPGIHAEAAAILAALRVDGYEIMVSTGKRLTEYDADAPRVGLAPDVAALSIGGQAPMGEVCITFDELRDALASVGDESGGGCEFEPTRPDDPDHHGPEFAKAVWDSVLRDREEVAALVRDIKP